MNISFVCNNISDFGAVVAHRFVAPLVVCSNHTSQIREGAANMIGLIRASQKVSHLPFTMPR